MNTPLNVLPVAVIGAGALPTAGDVIDRYLEPLAALPALAGDMGAADDVQLELPETGVCSADPLLGRGHVAGGDACCGGPASANTDACCVKDAQEKARGNAGCGCGTGKPAHQHETSACCNG